MSFKLCSLVFDFRTYKEYENDEGNIIVDTSEYTSNKIELTFDKLDSISIDENLQVCVAETIRGKNKTFNAYLQPKEFSISGSFSDRVTTDINYDPPVENADWLIGKKKSEYLNRLFTSLVESTILVNVNTFFKTYENCVITSFNLVYSDSSTIEVELNLKEVLLRDLTSYEKEENVTFSMLEKLTKDMILQYYGTTEGEFVLKNLEKLKETDTETYNKIITTAIQGGHYE